MMNAVLIHFFTYNTDASLKTQDLDTCEAVMTFRSPRSDYLQE